MRPTYLVIGAAKCGTTSLCHGLGAHPDVFMSRPREIHYFGRNDPAKTLEWYEAHFDPAIGYSAVGEGSTSYTHPDIIRACAGEISELIPKARLIYMVRNPLQRLESDWKMRRHEGWAGPSLHEEVTIQDSLVSHGRYWQNLSVYREHFPDEQILVLFLEDFARDQEAELTRCFTHIGVEPQAASAGQPRVMNESRSFRKDLALARWIRRSGLVADLRRAVPRPLFDLAKVALTRPDRYSVDWDPDIRRHVLEELAEDSRRLLEFCGKPPDFWDYDESPSR
jgi:hypothetical protein